MSRYIIALLAAGMLLSSSFTATGAGQDLSPDPGIVPFDARVKGKVLVSLYGGAALSFPWGTLNFTGRPRTELRYDPMAGARVAYPIVWWGGPIVGLEYARRDIAAENRSWAGRVRAGQRLEAVQLLAGWRQYTAWCFYGTGLVAGYNVGLWRNRLAVNGTEVPLGGLGGRPGASRRILLGLYTEVGAMIPLGSRVTLDITAQLQGFVLSAPVSAGMLHNGGHKPMAACLIAGVTLRNP